MKKIVIVRTALVGAALLGSVLAGLGPAEAGGRILCTGFTQCTDRGWSDAGYRAAQPRAHWNMTPGRNCTNYVAYRLTSNGRRTARPPHTNAAHTWGSAARASGVPVTDRPQVGSIAWWESDVYPARKKGHVAYVEQVRADGSILVSEDNMNQAFSWRRVVRGKGWPSGFLHFPTSDGSPSGKVTSVAADGGRLDLWTAASDPDAFGRPVRYEVVLDGALDDPEAERFTFTTGFFLSHRIKTVAARGSTVVRVYVHNKRGTDGEDVVRLGTRVVSID
ncbi:CHAP domain-containing protein [Aeromicrobium sp. Root495]|uniref:CHAP domain-containing protein n=1 Tax=Aeromicrobium sp. Root495 TaxID=1736550 RepID=UPI00138F810C|nr:CHAP domain-containing protein [Aeromicrobium sp. Root495]